MAYFAKIDNKVVTNVIYIENINVNNLPFPESELIGQTYIASLGIDGEWLQTSYNGNFRNCYAGINYGWNGTDFVPPVIIEV
jgi:hypothetical protein